MSTPHAPRSLSAAKSPNSLNLANIFTPTPVDVLSGRGGLSHRHPGNLAFRSLINARRGFYAVTTDNLKKAQMAKAVVGEIRQKGGRFLVRDKSTGLWNDIGDRQAEKKVAQALRENQTQVKRKIDEMITHPVVSPEECQNNLKFVSSSETTTMASIATFSSEPAKSANDIMEPLTIAKLANDIIEPLTDEDLEPLALNSGDSVSEEVPFGEEIEMLLSSLGNSDYELSSLGNLDNETEKWQFQSSFENSHVSNESDSLFHSPHHGECFTVHFGESKGRTKETPEQSLMVTSATTTTQQVCGDSGNNSPGQLPTHCPGPLATVLPPPPPLTRHNTPSRASRPTLAAAAQPLRLQHFQQLARRNLRRAKEQQSANKRQRRQSP